MTTYTAADITVGARTEQGATAIEVTHTPSSHNQFAEVHVLWETQFGLNRVASWTTYLPNDVLRGGHPIPETEEEHVLRLWQEYRQAVIDAGTGRPSAGDQRVIDYMYGRYVQAGGGSPKN